MTASPAFLTAHHDRSQHLAEVDRHHRRDPRPHSPNAFSPTLTPPVHDAYRTDRPPGVATVPLPIAQASESLGRPRPSSRSRSVLPVASRQCGSSPSPWRYPRPQIGVFRTNASPTWYVTPAQSRMRRCAGSPGYAQRQNHEGTRMIVPARACRATGEPLATPEIPRRTRNVFHRGASPSPSPQQAANAGRPLCPCGGPRRVKLDEPNDLAGRIHQPFTTRVCVMVPTSARSLTDPHA